MVDRDDSATTFKTSAVVDRLYEVALEPTRYESLLDAWEAELAPLRTGPKARQAADMLEAHVARASAFLDRYQQVRHTRVADSLHDFAPLSAVSLDRRCTVIAANFDLCERNASAQLEDIPFLTAQSAGEMRDLVEEVFATGHEVIRSLPHTDDATGIALVKLRPVSAEAETMVAIFSRLRWNAQVAKGLRRAFRLSKTETDILRLILEIKGRTEIARIRNRSPETIKRHFSSIFQKVGCRSSSELLLIAMSFIGLISDEALAGSGEAAGLRTIDAPGGEGQRVHYVAAGAESDRVLIHLPGPYCLSKWPRPAEIAAKARGLCVITPIRRGYGPTIGQSVEGDLASDVADEIVALMDALGVKRAPILTQSNDIVFAFRLARKHPARVSAIIACGGATPIVRPEQYSRMHKWHRFVLANANFAKRSLPFIVKAGFMLAQRIGKQRFLERVYAKVPGDMAVLSVPHCSAALLEGSRFALSDAGSAHRAFTETVLYFGRPDWAADVHFAAGRVPVYLINGSQDPMIPPQTLNEVAQAYPWISYRIYEEAGEFVFFKHWPDVLDIVMQHVR